MNDETELHEEEEHSEKRVSTRARLFELMIAKVQSGEWKVGMKIPSERDLMSEFNVSRIALREALSMLRALGILDISQGRKTTVGRMNTEVIGRLFPLMLSFESDQTLGHVFELRLALETQSAYWAAKRRSDEQLIKMELLQRKYQADSIKDTPESIEIDQKFHAEIAHATGNPLFSILLESLSEIFKYAQRESGKQQSGRKKAAILEHDEIMASIQAQDAQRAADAMSTHLRDASSSHED